ncbi:MAG: hypothetical protein H6799_02095 [Candidatus Nomurabacteria bacterium]|nr:MAG: hypothetical protein H6799_02095 [Candidatus Nomurabacteria bacterium]
MGEIPVTFLYPEDNFRWMLRHLDSQDQKVVLQSAQKKPVDTQGRLTVGSMAGQGTNADPVTVMGRGTCLQVVPECVGEFLASRNQENLDNLLNSN